MKNFLFALGLIISKSMISQITFKQDNRIDQYLYQKKPRLLTGYRVQICFDPEKSVVEEVRNRFVSSYPKIDTYMSFEPPYFNLKVGDFRTQIEAQTFAEKLQGAYTLNIVHKEQINLPRID
ncbi:MAG: hypothetical protein ACKO7P_08000 [Bacteroidota bacterium]|nr:hypothetical protein [Bacteroidota bacterium]